MCLHEEILWNGNESSYICLTYVILLVNTLYRKTSFSSSTKPQNHNVCGCVFNLEQKNFNDINFNF